MPIDILSDDSPCMIQAKLRLFPSIYVTCLEAYEKGMNYGEWIAVDKSLEEL